MLEISCQLPSTRFQVCSCNTAGYRGISFLQDRGLTLIGIWSKWNRKWKFEYSITCCWTWTSKGLFKYINTVNIIEHDIFKQSLQPGPLLDSQLEFQLLGLMLSDRMKSSWKYWKHSQTRHISATCLKLCAKQCGEHPWLTQNLKHIAEILQVLGQFSIVTSYCVLVYQ